MLQARVEILYNKKIKGNYFHLVLSAPKISKESLPGQFLQIKVNDAYAPLLRRPLSIHRLKGTNIELLYEVVGKATEILSQRKAGEYLDVIGPLGNGFGYTLHATGCTLHVLVAGGIGVAPLVFLAERLMSNEQRAKSKELLVLIGAKTKDKILCEKEFKDLGCEVRISTDDGSKGFKGKVTDLLERLLLTMSAKNIGGSARICGGNYKLSTIYACGPRPMLKEISRISKEYNISTQVSLEEHMACGIGACLGCAVNTKDGFKRACKEGPVFKTDRVVW